MKRAKRALGLSLVMAFASGGAVAQTQGAEGDALQPNDASLVALGRDVYDAHCASCHGAELEGAPNWRERDADGRLPAPPHDATGHTWHHPDEILFSLTKYGVAALIGDPSYPTNMPAYDGVLSDREIIAALSFIKSTWPDDVIAVHDEINAQARGQ